MKLARITLFLAALMFLVLGVWLVAAPEKLEEWLGIVASTPAARTDLRAIYGGVEIGLGLFLLCCAARRELVALGCLAMMLVLGAVALARVYGMVQDQSADTMMTLLLATELVFAVLGGWCLLRTRTTRHNIQQ